MQSSISTSLLRGVEGRYIRVEVVITPGLPVFDIVGMADRSIREAQKRIRAALTHLGLPLPPGRVTVSLQPGWIPKSGSCFDLPIALAIIQAQECRTEAPRLAAIGEISLTGEILPVRGALPLVEQLPLGELDAVLVPQTNLGELSCLTDVPVIGISDLTEAITCSHMSPSELQTYAADAHHSDDIKVIKKQEILSGCLSHLKALRELNGQYLARRGLLAAAAGGHHMLMLGSQGSGKTTLARFLGALLPDFDRPTLMETLKVYSAAGLMGDTTDYSFERPLRAPHYTTSLPNLIGGGGNPVPGEVSLAHGGVLFIDEIHEAPPATLAALRLPLEEKVIKVIRHYEQYSFPADFIFVGAGNPCPCGRYLDQTNQEPCVCTDHEIRRYQKKLNGPFTDRIDLCIELRRPTAEDLEKGLKADSNVDLEGMRDTVKTARSIQGRRNGKDEKGRPILNSELDNKDLVQKLGITPEGERLALQMGNDLKLTTRGFYKMIKTARTLADLEESETVAACHFAEAAQFRWS